MQMYIKTPLSDMTQRALSAHWLVLITLAAVVAVMGMAFVARAELNVSFPIAELGGCESKEACKAYCDDPANVSACVDFAKAHGLVKGEDGERAKKFGRAIDERGGPGGCRTPGACKLYCDDVAHLAECIAFAEEHDIVFPKDGSVKKLAAYLKSGGTTPGGCRSKDACEAYCHDQSHFEECATFAERAGLKQQEEVEKLRELGGKGPGGCMSRDACEAYCRDDAHREECYRFAEEHGLLPKEDIEHAKEGLVRMRAGLENAPSEVAACVKNALGTDVVERIMRGEFTPGPEVGEKLRACFEKFGGDARPRELFRDAPADVVLCLKEKLGAQYDAVRSGTEQPTPEMADTLRVCFAKTQMMRGSGGAFMSADAGEEPTGMAPEDFLRNAPPGIRECVAQKLGATTLPRAMEMTAELKEELRGCFESFKPGESQPAEGTVPGMRMGGALAECLARAKEEVRSRLGDAPDTASAGQVIAELNKKCYVQFGPGEGSSTGSGQAGGFVPPKPIGPPVNDEETKPPSLAPEAVQCLRTRVSAVEFENLMRGGKPGPEAEAKIRECMEGFLKNRPEPTPGLGDCPQQLTQAQDPISGACKTFPSPCGVPRGWKLGCTPGGATAPQEPFMPMFPPPQFDKPAPPPAETVPPPSSFGPLQNATAQVSKNPFEIFVRFLLGL